MLHCDAQVSSRHSKTDRDVRRKALVEEKRPPNINGHSSFRTSSCHGKSRPHRHFADMLCRQHGLGARRYVAVSLICTCLTNIALLLFLECSFMSRGGQGNGRLLRYRRFRGACYNRLVGCCRRRWREERLAAAWT